MITKVMLWSNGVIMVFDERGEQMPEYQGHGQETITRILLNAPARAAFFEGNWHKGILISISREEFKTKAVVN
jgi:hypothetical protein